MARDGDTPLTRLHRWQAGETPGPWTITLIPTNRCNLRCEICWQRRTEADFGHEVQDSRLEELVDEAAAMGVREWNISGGGEPMARAGLVLSLCERIRERDMNGALQTNATLSREAGSNS